MIQDFENQIKEKTDNQLSEIFINANKYQPEFIKLVELELVHRKIPIDSLKFIKEKQDKILDESLEIGKQGNPVWIIVSFISSLFGGLPGIVAGYVYAYSMHKNSKGDKYYYYNESTRKYGRWILIMGCTVLGLAILSKII